MEEGDRRDMKMRNRIIIYKEVLKFERKAMLYRRLYNYFRVTSAILGSVSFLVVLVLLLFVTGRENREIKLIDGVEHQLKALFHTFLDSSSVAAANFLEQLKLVRDTVFITSLVTSLLSMFLLVQRGCLMGVPKLKSVYL